MTDIALIVKDKMTSLPEKAKLSQSQLDMDAKSLLYDMDGTIDLIQTIQVMACESSIKVKRKMRQESIDRKALELASFRNDPLSVVQIHEHSLFLDDSFWEQFPTNSYDDFKQKLQKLLVMAPNPTDMVLETYCNLQNAPDLLSSDLFTSLFAYVYRKELAQITSIALSMVQLFTAFVPDLLDGQNY